MLLRDETQMAMNQVETLCFEIADHYQSAAQRTADAQASQRFAGRAQQLRDSAAELAPHIRRLDDLPQQPDPDREAVSEVLAGIKAFLSGDPGGAAVREQQAWEDRLEEAIAAARKRPLPDDTQSLLARLQQEAAEAKAAHGASTD